MIRRRPPVEALGRVLENAALLAFASLLVMSVMAGRYAGALLWSGALIVFFTHAWESRSLPLDTAERLPLQASRSQRYDRVRWIGLALAVVGAAALTS
ncbi:MAG TPA: hypothetical protein VJ501_14235 [Burkholderiaceae bacterium]|nr:hypothetical protein [Burkholderiaceae bacterium]